MSFINLQLRRANAATWAGLNLASGEIGLETDTSKFKINYSATTQPWSAVSYVSTGGGGGGPIDIGGPYGQHLYTGQTAPLIADFPNAVINDIYLKTDTNDAYVTERTNYTTPTPTSLFSESGHTITSIIKVGAYLYAVDQGRHNILKYDISAQTTSVFAGASDGSPGYINDTGTAARFQGPTSIVYDGTANFYVSDTGNNCIRAIIEATGTVTLLVGLAVQLTSDTNDDPFAPFTGGAGAGDYGIANLPPFSDDSVTAGLLGDVAAPEYMVWANSKIYFTESGNTKIRTCDPADIVTVNGPPQVPPQPDYNGSYSSPRLTTVLSVSATTNVNMIQDSGSIYILAHDGGGDYYIYSLNTAAATISLLYSLPIISGTTYDGLFYKSTAFYITLNDATNSKILKLEINLPSAPVLSTILTNATPYESVYFFIDNDSLNTLYFSGVSGLKKIPAGLAFALIPEQTKSPQTENFVVAGGVSPRKLIYSYDGLRWLVSPTENVISYKVNSVAFNGTIWVAGGWHDGDANNMTTLAYSSDGINWTASVSGSTLITEQVNSVVWTGSVWVAGGASTSGGATTYTLVYSYDGINWLLSQQQFGPTVISLHWTGNMVICSNDDNAVNFSYDGISWFSSTTASTHFNTVTSPFWPLCYASSDTLIVAGCHDVISLSWSEDGFNWTTSSNAALFTRVNGLAYNGSMWVAAGIGPNYVAYSLNGKDWTASESANKLFFDETPQTVTWNGSLWLVGGTGPDNLQMAYSYDGIHWLPVTSANDLDTGRIHTLCNRKVNTANYKNTALTENFMVAAGSGANNLAFSYDGLNWYPSPSGNVIFSSGTCKALEWNGTIWVAGGDGDNRLAYSVDGKTWELSSSGNTAIPYSCNCIKWNGELWVAAGGDNTHFNAIAYSKDGINWTAVANPTSIVMISYSLEYNGSFWLIGGNGDAGPSIGYSEDGISWKQVTGTGDLMYTVRAITWNGTMFVAGGTAEAQATGVNTLMYSYDGFNWTASPSSNTIIPTQANAVAWNGKMWVCGGLGTDGDDTMAYSNDGITWTAGNTHTITHNISSIAWNGNLWTAGSGTDDVSIMIHSYDGIDWFRAKQQYSPFGSECRAIRARKVNNYTIPTPTQTENFMVAGGLQAILAYTYDGLSWLASPSGKTVFSDVCLTVGWSGLLWVAGGIGSNGSLAYSTDGINWASVPGSNDLTETVRCVKWNGTMWLAGAFETNRILYSYDGITWQGATSANALCSDIKTLEWNGTIWLAGGVGASKILYSYDGLLWKAVVNAPAFGSAANSIVWNGKMWLAGGDNTDSNTRISYSYDGITWTDSASGTSLITSAVNGISWNGVQWLAVGYGTNYIAYSYDGISWTEATSANTIYAGMTWAAKWNGSLWVVAGDSDCSLAYSYDGIQWTKSDSGNRCLGTDSFCVEARIVNLPPKTITTPTENFMVAGTTLSTTNVPQTLIYYSHDGLLWHASPSVIFDYGGACSVKQIEYNGSVWILIGINNTSPMVLYSTDGINWTPSTSANDLLSTDAPISVKWSNNLWLIGTLSTTMPMIYSHDGINWVAVENGIFGDGASAIETDGYTWVAGASGVYGYSNDGLNWDILATPFPAANITSLLWNGSIWVAGFLNGTLYHSQNGVSWTLATDTAPYDGVATFAGGQVLCVTYNNATWVAVGQFSTGEACVISSSDGINWSIPISFPSTDAGQMRTVEWNGSFFSAYGVRHSNGNITYGVKSYDGTNWVLISGSKAVISTQKSRRITAPPTVIKPLTENFMVAGGRAGSKIAYTYDGLNWLSSPSGPAAFTADCNSVAWNGSLWVAGGSGNHSLAYSVDGINWTSVTGSANLSSGVLCVKWNGSIWLAGTNNTNFILYSYDGISWEPALSANEISISTWDLAWNGHMWLAAITGMARIMYSYDGINWEGVMNGPIFAGSAYAVAWNGLIWLAGGDSTATQSCVSYSYDGVIWTDPDLTGIDVLVYRVSWNGSQWLALGEGTEVVSRSPDGINWNASASAKALYTTGMVYDAKWNGKFWVAVGDGTNGLSYSYDGNNWFKIESGNSCLDNAALSICSRIVNLPPKIQKTLSENFMVAGSAAGSKIAYTYDGLNWLSSPSGNTAFSDRCRTIEWNGSLWVAGGVSTNGSLAYSTDGIKWTSVTGSNDLATTVVRIKWNGIMWLAGTNSTNRILYSYNGMNWEAALSANAICTEAWDFAWDGNMWLAAVASTSKILYSYDGITWKAASNGPPFYAKAYTIAWNGSIWVAGGGTDTSLSTLAYSYDGLTWTGSATGTTLISAVVARVSWNGSQWLAVGNGTNEIAYSSDGITWTAAVNDPPPFPSGAIVEDIAWNGSFWVAVSRTEGSAYSYDGSRWYKLESANYCLDTGVWGIASRKINLPPKIQKTLSENFMVAGGGSGSKIAYTYDGLNWLPSPSGSILDSGCSAIAWNGTLWVAGGLGTNACLAYSTDGIDWTPVAGSNDLISDIYSIKWNGTIWLAGGLSTTTNKLLYSYDGMGWKAASSANALCETVISFGWNGLMWLAATQGANSLLYSYDGITWQSVLKAPLFSTGGHAIAWNGSIWVAGGDSTATYSTLAYSYDGVIWFDSATTAIDTLVYGVSWNGKQWLALGQGTDVVARSTDGINWTASPSAKALYTTGMVKDAEWNGNFWVAAGTGTNGLSYSYDGNSWFKIDSGNRCLVDNVVTICSRNVNLPPKIQKTLSENFMVAGASITAFNVTRAMMYYSYDGITWQTSQSSSNLFTNFGAFMSIWEIDWNGSMWIAACRNAGVAYIISSSDGINWAPVTSANTLLSSAAGYANAVKWGKNVWVIGAASGTVALIYSYDGVNWLASTTGSAIFTGGLGQIATNGNLWIAAAATKFAYSNDGITWLALSDPFSGKGINTLVWNGTIWVAGVTGVAAASLYYSTDGLSWTESADAGSYDGNGVFTGNGVTGIAFNNSVWVAAGQTSTAKVAYSYDGINWTSAMPGWNLTGTLSAQKIEWNGSFFSIYGFRAGQVAYSAISYDGITWVENNLPPRLNITAVKSRQPRPITHRSMDDLVVLSPAEDAAVVIDCNASTKFYINADGENTISFINLPAFNSRVTTLEINVNGSIAVVWPAINWMYGAPSVALGGTTFYTVQLRYQPQTSPLVGEWIGSISY
jgi:hypothetical protein